ncbi:MAG: peptide deformylase [Treponema sp.]|jgi:peptide deformylase|nr:peptide deformylase [Treponema sp.]
MEVIHFAQCDDAPGDKTLREKAAPVKDIDDKIRETAAEMRRLMEKDRGVGLAAPQVGILRRLFVTHAEGDQFRVFINPAITWTSQEQVKYEEGCLSLPGIWAEVVRPQSIRIQAWNENGRAFTLEVSGILARVIQHEYDHLEGVLFIDRVNEVKRNKLLAKIGQAAAKKVKKTAARYA